MSAQTTGLGTIAAAKRTLFEGLYLSGGERDADAMHLLVGNLFLIHGHCRGPLIQLF